LVSICLPCDSLSVHRWGLAVAHPAMPVSPALTLASPGARKCEPPHTAKKFASTASAAPSPGVDKAVRLSRAWLKRGTPGDRAGGCPLPSPVAALHGLGRGGLAYGAEVESTARCAPAAQHEHASRRSH